MKISKNKLTNSENLNHNAEDSLNLGYSERERMQLIRQSYIDIINIVSDAIYVLDESFSFIEVNKGAEIMYQYTREELIGQNPESVAAPGLNDMESILNLMKTVLKTGIPVRFDFWAKRKNGEIFPKEVIVNKGKFFDQNVLIATARDITAQKQTLKELESKENVHSTILQTVMDGFWLITNQGKILDVNNECSKILGYSQKELLQMSVIDIEMIDKQEDVNRRLQNLLNSESERFETKFRHKDGYTLDVEVSIKLSPNHNGNVVAFFRDITERKLYENTIIKSEEKFRKAFMTNPDCVSINRLDDGLVVLLNQGFTNVLGYTEEEILGKTTLEKNIWYDPLDRKRWVNELNCKNEVHNFVTRLRTKDGSVIYAIVSAVLIELDDVMHVLSITHDITDMKNAENILKTREGELDTLINTLPDLVWLKDTDGVYINCNNRFEEFFGATKKEIIGKTDYDFLEKELADFFRNHDANAIKASKSTKNEEWITFASDNHREYLETIKTPMYDNDGNLIGVLGIGRDITERRNAEHALKESNDRLKVILESTPIAIWDWDVTTDKWYATSKYYTMLGYEPEIDYQDRQIWLNRIHPDDRQMVNDKIAKILNHNDENYSYEARMLHADGSYRWQTVIGQVVERDAAHKTSRLIGVRLDVNDRKIIELELRESEERFKVLFEKAPDAMFLAETETRKIVDANAAACSLFKKGKNELIGLYQYELHPENLILKSKEEFDVHSNQNSNTGSILPLENTIITSEGNEIPVEIMGQSIKIGEKELLLGTFRDISERKKSEKKLIESVGALRRQNGLFDSLIRNLPMGVFMVEAPSGKPLLANDAALTLLGRGILPDANKQNLHDVYDAYKTGSDIKYPVDEMPIIRGMKGESSRIDDMLVKRPDGTDTLLEIFGSPVTDEVGNIWASLVSFMDISDRKKAERALKESEEKLSALFAAMTEMVVIHELVFDKGGNAVDYRLLDCNEVFSTITGMKKLDVVGKLASEVYNSTPPPYLDIYAKVAMTGESHEFTTYYPPMDKHFMISVVSPSKNQFATITADVSAMKQAQDEILYKSKELENYLYVASHDLRSPLVNIQGFSQRLQKQYAEIKTFSEKLNVETEFRENIDKLTNEDMPRTLNFIQTNVTKMNNLIDSLLQISRTGRMPLEIKELDMNMLMNKVIVSYNYELTELNATIKTEDLPPCFGDENQLNQVFSNIIGNALKYRSSDRKPEIKISAKQTHNRIVYSISDNGKGIAERHLEKIWDVFYRIDHLASEAGEGIGLSIAKTIVTKHKGRVWVESEENKGTTFNIELLKNIFSEI